jgi:DNA ligase-1
MKEFAALLDRLLYTPARNGKLALLARYFRSAADPDRGWGLAALTGTLDLRAAKPALIRGLVAERTDATLFALSYDYVGDLAETCALLWPERGGAPPPRLGAIVDAMRRAGRSELPGLIAGWLDGLDATGRWTLFKLITGGLRVGVSARLAKAALAEAFVRPLAEIEEIWHGQDPPFVPLFAWLEGHAERPDAAAAARFRPFMLAHPLEDPATLEGGDWQVEWKWDGIRVELVATPAAWRLFSRAGDDISAAFPDVTAGLALDGVIDGELLVRGADGEPAPFNHLQQRLNRKAADAALAARYPAFIRAYDLLFSDGEDWRPRPLAERRRRLEALLAAHPHPRLDLSPILPLAAPDALARLQSEARALGREGLMLKRRDSAYEAGRVKGAWFKWKREPLVADAVLLYAQRGHGKRSSYFSDYTFGVWRGDELVPVGKAYFGFTDEELKRLDRWVREHTVERFGPVSAVTRSLVFEVAFDSVHASPRHKSGLALRFPRISRIRWEKPAAEADRIEALERLMAPEARPTRR